MSKLASTLRRSLRQSSTLTSSTITVHNARTPFSASARASSSTPAGFSASRNRIYTPIRHPSELHEAILLSSSARQPLITYWTASYCPPCKTIRPLLNKLLQCPVPPCPSDPANAVAFAEVEFDAPDIMGSSVPMDFMVNSLPSMLAFDRGEVVERLNDVSKMSNEQFLREWIERQSKRKGEGSGGGKGLLGGLFSKV